jgi:hypothetical protein
VRRANKRRSWFVLAIALTMGTAVQVGFDLQTVICQEPSVSRESVAGTKLLQPADASLTMTIWWRQSLGSITSQAQQQPPQSPNMTFFVTSTGPGKGADLGGLEGADR